MDAFMAGLSLETRECSRNVHTLKDVTFVENILTLPSPKDYFCCASSTHRLMSRDENRLGPVTTQEKGRMGA